MRIYETSRDEKIKDDKNRARVTCAATLAKQTRQLCGATAPFFLLRHSRLLLLLLLRIKIQRESEVSRLHECNFDGCAFARGMFYCEGCCRNLHFSYKERGVSFGYSTALYEFIISGFGMSRCCVFFDN